jgi:hypothetical protein
MHIFLAPTLYYITEDIRRIREFLFSQKSTETLKVASGISRIVSFEQYGTQATVAVAILYLLGIAIQTLVRGSLTEHPLQRLQQRLLVAKALQEIRRV